MVSQEVVNYIKQNLAKGFTREQIHQTLLSSGNSEEDINESFELANLAEQSMIKTKEIENQLQKKTNNFIQQNNNDPIQNSEQYQTSEADNNQDNSNNSFNPGDKQPEQSNQQPETDKNQDNNNPKKVKLSLPVVAILVVCVTVLGLGLFFANNMFNQSLPEESRQIIAEDSIPESEQDIFEDIEIAEEQVVSNESDEDITTPDQTSDSRCRISANVLSLELDVGVTRGIVASGYLGDVFDVSWRIEDESIGRMMPPIGTASAVTALNPGSTRIVVTDTSMGPDCVYYISLNIIE